MTNMHDRANQLFNRAEQLAQDDFKQLVAEHAAKGLLRSGATAKRAIAIYKARLSGALTQVLNEIPTQLEHRGRAWTKACDEVADVLKEASGRANKVLTKPFQLAGIAGDAQKACDALLAEVFADLNSQLEDFREGWTAPKPKGWHERYPVLYAVAMLIAGGIVGIVITTLTD